jgi:triacylglycerol lipase
MPLKYPVVLVHGTVAHDRWKIVNFWGRIPKKLTEKGVKVFYGNTDAWGDLKTNAKTLKATIEQILHETQAEKVNIIAHSKGGLDSRYCIWKYKLGGKVASLTTLSTPHHGSEIADLIFKLKIAHSPLMKKTLDAFAKLYGDINPNLYNVNRQLTTKRMKAFNKKVVMDDRVYYQSLYTTMRNSMDDLMFFYSHLYVKTVSGENDGVVSERSAQWGNNVVKIEGGISHAEIVDYKRMKISGINIPEIYLGIIDELSKKRF